MILIHGNCHCVSMFCSLCFLNVFQVVLVFVPPTPLPAGCNLVKKYSKMTFFLYDFDRTNAEFLEPKTPSPKHTNSRKKLRKAEPGLAQKMLAIANNSSVFDCSSGIDNLWWHNRKPFRRAAKKRTVLDSLSPFIYTQQ